MIVGVTVVKGKVFVKKPGTNKFVEITGTTEIPIGSQVDTTKGTLRLTSSLGGGRTNAADFFDGIFQIFQRRARNSVTLLKLDHELTRLWDAPVKTPALRWGI